MLTIHLTNGNVIQRPFPRDNMGKLERRFEDEMEANLMIEKETGYIIIPKSSILLIEYDYPETIKPKVKEITIQVEDSFYSKYEDALYMVNAIYVDSVFQESVTSSQKAQIHLEHHSDDRIRSLNMDEFREEFRVISEGI
jgi:hypothetical protein